MIIQLFDNYVMIIWMIFEWYLIDCLSDCLIDYLMNICHQMITNNAIIIGWLFDLFDWSFDWSFNWFFLNYFDYLMII